MSFLIYLLVVVVVLVVAWLLTARMDNIARDKVKEWKKNHSEEEQALINDYRNYVKVSFKEIFKSRKKK